MVALLQALSETSEDEEGARLLGLSRVAEGTLFAATWPTSPDKVRTLTNSDGEQAMPLFSGLDNLEAAARRFGWLNPDGSLSFREMPAREALQSAVAQAVHFVVLDIHAEYATEFTRDEVGAGAARGAADASGLAARGRTAQDALAIARSPRSVRRSSDQGQHQAFSTERAAASPSGRLAAAAIKKAQGGIAEIDLPFAERGTGPDRGAAAARSRVDRRDAPARDRQARPARRSAAADSQGAASAPARKETKKAMPWRILRGRRLCSLVPRSPRRRRRSRRGRARA